MKVNFQQTIHSTCLLKHLVLVYIRQLNDTPWLKKGSNSGHDEEKFEEFYTTCMEKGLASDGLLVMLEIYFC